MFFGPSKRVKEEEEEEETPKAVYFKEGSRREEGKGTRSVRQRTFPSPLGFILKYHMLIITLMSFYNFRVLGKQMQI